MPNVFGIDISSYTIANDWKAVSNQNVRFVFVRASENGFGDAGFTQNWQSSKSVGMLRGAYHFFHSETNNSAAQAAKFIQTVGSDKGELPPILDLESVYVNGNPISLPVGTAMLALIKDWLDRVELAFGRKPMIYTSTEFIRSHSINAPWLVNYPLWIAQYPYMPGTSKEYHDPQNVPTPGPTMPEQPTGFQPWSFWQYSSKGLLSGFPPNQPVDFDYFNGSLADLNKFASIANPSSNPPKPAPPPGPAPVPTQYTVQSGDTLASIAKKFNVDLAQLTNLNNAALIRPGEVLAISASPQPAPSGPVSPPSPVTPAQTYTVKSGDTLTAIAARFGTTVAALSAANNITNPNLISIGQVLKIPK
jgi:lysozyme